MRFLIFLVKLPLKLILIPVWLFLAVAGLIVSLIVGIYNFGRTIAAFILILLLIGVLFCYQDWIQAGILITLYLILFALLFVGTAVEVILEEIRSRVMGFILS